MRSGERKKKKVSEPVLIINKLTQKVFLFSKQKIIIFVGSHSVLRIILIKKINSIHKMNNVNISIHHIVYNPDWFRDGILDRSS